MHQRIGLLEKQDGPCIHLAYAGTITVTIVVLRLLGGAAVAMTSYEYSHRHERMTTLNARWIGVRHTAAAPPN